MKKYINPDKSQWDEISKRPNINQEQLKNVVSTIINNVKQNGDDALFNYSNQFDGVELKSLKVNKKELLNAGKKVSSALKNAIKIAYDNIYSFHNYQKLNEGVIETTPGVICWRKSLAIEKVGLYIPGGSAPLFSTILMLGIPAQIAGCNEIIICTPPNKNGEINPVILYTANLIGITKIYKVGGAQAIAAMANGTETIPKTYKIFGPGNQYVTKAKEMIQQAVVAIDMPAGPS